MKGVLCRFNAIVGDASCQIRAVVGSHLFDILRAAVSKQQWSNCIVHAETFSVVHRNHKHDAMVKTVAGEEGV
jgi:hypothetical protein